MGASPRWTVAQNDAQPRKGLSKAVRPLQGRISLDAFLSVGFTHGYSKCSPYGEQSQNPSHASAAESRAFPSFHQMSGGVVSYSHNGEHRIETPIRNVNAAIHDK